MLRAVNGVPAGGKGRKAGPGALAATGFGGDGVAREDWLGLLEASGALLRGHFRLSSGLHSPAYVQCARLLEDPGRARQVGRGLAQRLAAYRPDSVLSPALGAILVGHETAAALGVQFRFTEREAGKMVLRRGFALAPGERVVVVEDAVTTGGSTRETTAAARAAGAEVVAVGAILDRSGGANPFDVPFESLVTLDLPTYRPDDCPLCREGSPAVKPGSRPGS
jgi:orotate phosphoribosyltransferase